MGSMLPYIAAPWFLWGGKDDGKLWKMMDKLMENCGKVWEHDGK
jgi:hypothetical protein